MIRGLGIDLVDVDRLRKVVERRGPRFLRRVYTPAELGQAQDHPRRYEFLASRFAVKEAVFKALGTGLVRGMGWEQIEIDNLASGQPRIRLNGGCRERFRSLGAKRIHVSLSHTPENAVAIVILE